MEDIFIEEREKTEEEWELEFEQMCDYYGYPKFNKLMPHQCYNVYIGLE